MLRAGDVQEATPKCRYGQQSWQYASSSKKKIRSVSRIALHEEQLNKHNAGLGQIVGGSATEVLAKANGPWGGSCVSMGAYARLANNAHAHACSRRVSLAFDGTHFGVLLPLPRQG